MSNFDSIWNQRQQADAHEEGWELGLVVDEGKSVDTAYFDVFDKGPRFHNRRAAMVHVVDQAKKRSRLHIAALSACSASRVDAAARTTRKKK